MQWWNAVQGSQELLEFQEATYSEHRVERIALAIGQHDCDAIAQIYGHNPRVKGHSGRAPLTDLSLLRPEVALPFAGGSYADYNVWVTLIQGDVLGCERPPLMPFRKICCQATWSPHDMQLAHLCSLASWLRPGSRPCPTAMRAISRMTVQSSTVTPCRAAPIYHVRNLSSQRTTGSYQSLRRAHVASVNPAHQLAIRLVTTAVCSLLL